MSDHFLSWPDICHSKKNNYLQPCLKAMANGMQGGISMGMAEFLFTFVVLCFQSDFMSQE
jgi:hypothetical protein